MVLSTSDLGSTGLVLTIAAIGTVISLVYVLFTVSYLKKQKSSDADVESEEVATKMDAFAADIQKGAKDFLKTEYKYLSIFVAVFAILLFVIFAATDNGSGDRYLHGLKYSGCFVLGAILSALAGWFGMIIATEANVKTAHAACAGGASSGLNDALQVAFAGGSVMGFTVVGLGLFGLVCLYALLSLDVNEGDVNGVKSSIMTYLTGFGFGASSIALFARVAGGIYTKAADVGADLVGKYENDLQEDDPKNPAVIADNVGDNVGDVAGMGADLFESYVGSIIAAGYLANQNIAEVALPFWIAGAGVIASLIGTKCIKTKSGASQKDLLLSLRMGTVVAMALVFALSALSIYLLDLPWEFFGCMVIGLCTGELIGYATERATSYTYQPTMSIANAGKTGPATVIIQGLGVGMLSCFPPVILTVAAIISCNALAGGFGIAVAAVGMLSTLGVTLATDAYGPVADNAGGIAEMSGLPEEVREITDSLDALGNTTAATGKGFAIGSAVLTALSLLASFKEAAGLADDKIDIADPIVLGGILIGAVLPFIFAALTMLSVRKAAEEIILNVRYQFASNPALLDPNANESPDYEQCIRISTEASIKEMILPGFLAVMAPITIGVLVGPTCLAGLLTGSIASGFMLAVMMSNAGGAWDNAKKYMEIELKLKNSDQHKATVVGDTVGDPFKDTSGPALNILIKLMSMVSLVLAPLINGNGDWDTFEYGFIPLALVIIVTFIDFKLFWSGFDEKIEAKHKQIDAIKNGKKSTTQNGIHQNGEKEGIELVNVAVVDKKE